jgi:acetyl esterase/lipase
MVIVVLAAAMAAMATPATAVTADPPRDAAHPAAMAPLLIPSGDGAMNAVLYEAAGAGPHPTLILFHGFPGNEQNLDLAQAARRAGWTVLTLHYRGTWGSRGTFSLEPCAEDAHAALAWLRDPAHAARFAIDPARIAVAGHSMGGMMAARLAADDHAVLGSFLIDPWDIAHESGNLADPHYVAAFRKEELDGDMPPLAGVTEDEVIDQIRHAGPPLDLAATIPALADRPLALTYTEFGNGKAEAIRIGAAAHAARAGHLQEAFWSTDHSFSDKRIALAEELVAWLKQFDR